MSRKLQIIVAVMATGLILTGCSQKTTNTKTETIQASEQEEVQEETEEVEDESQVIEDKSESDESATTEEVGKNQEIGDSSALPKPAVSAEQLITEAYGKDDPYYDFKVEFTKDYLEKVNNMYSLLSEDYVPETDDDTSIYTKDSRGQLKYERKVEDYDKRYQYIYELSNYLGFEDDTSDLYAWQSVEFNLCDEDNDGKIELNDTTTTMLKTAYPNIDLAAVQEKINEAIENEKVQSSESVRLETGDKYYKPIYFHWFRYNDNPVQVEFSIDYYQDYPAK